MIIDTHTHFYDPSRPEGVPWPPADNELLYRTVLPEHWKAVAEPEGVTGTVVVEASAWLDDNQWVLDLATDDSSIVGLVGHIDPGRSEFGSELRQHAVNPLFRGIRCGAGYFADVHSGSFLDDMRLLAELDLQLDVLLRDTDFPQLIKLAQSVPDLRIVIDHIGHMSIDGNPIQPRWVEQYKRLGAEPNIHMKVSALIEQSTIQPAPDDVEHYRPTLDVLWDAFGEERLIYGSNWPVCERAGDYALNMKIVRNYFGAKGEAAAAKYFWQNAKRVYQWVER